MKKVLGIGALTVLLGIVAAVVVVVLFPVPEPNDFAIAETSEVLYSDGTTSIVQVGDITRRSIPISQVPEHVQEAVMAAEDRDYYEHGGFSPAGLARALINNVQGGVTQGGSTITQQYVKNAYLTQEQTITRKVKELILAIKIDTTQSKDEVMEDYLNTIYFGRGAYGIEAASVAYYGHGAAELTPAEGVALAGLIQSPGNYEPTLYPDRLQQRFDYVVGGMQEKGWVTAEEAQWLTMPEFLPVNTANRYGGQTGYIAGEVRRELKANGFTDEQIDQGGLRITTTIDPRAQAEIVQAVEQRGPKSGTDGLRIGAASVDPDTGGILAMYGGPDYVTSSLNNATQATAQAGSTFKPFALAAAFEKGYTLNSRFNGNSPATIAGYTLENEGNKSYGSVTLGKATEQSINTAFVALAHKIGIENVMDAAYRAGIPASTTPQDVGLSFVLGSSSMSPVQMASAYATFAARGVYHTPHIVSSVSTPDGEVLYTADVAGEQRFAPEIADQVNAALERVITNGTATRGQSVGRPVAGKTGTTDENKSAWFVGYGPQVATSVMLSKEDEAGNPVSLRGTGGMQKVFGSSFPLAIWSDYMQDYLAELPVEDFAAPPRQGSSAWNGSGNSGSSSNNRSVRPTPAPAPAWTATAALSRSPRR
jgi:membrane peptidoglycan carboxypeptidase